MIMRYLVGFALGCSMLSATVLAQPAKRIVALSPHSVEMLYAIGAGDAIVATTDYADYPEAAKHIPRIGGYYGIQMERVLALAPDLIVVWDSGNKAEDISQLKELGFTLYHSSPNRLEDVARELEELGELTGKREQAKQMAADYRAQLMALRLENEHKTAVKVFYQLWSTPLMTVSKNSWIQQLIDVCHGQNVFYAAPSDYPQVSLENVLLVMPEVIVQSAEKGNVQDVDWSAWPEIPAVKNKQIYPLNADLLHRASPRVLHGVTSLCEALDRARGSP
ncbi:MAG: cobalamin-binding protein [Shewanella sp.]